MTKEEELKLYRLKLNAIAVVLKARFTNLTVLTTLEIADDILDALNKVEMKNG